MRSENIDGGNYERQKDEEKQKGKSKEEGRCQKSAVYGAFGASLCLSAANVNLSIGLIRKT